MPHPKKFTFDFVKSYFQQFNCILLSKEYIDCDTHLDFICHCGKKARTTFWLFKQSKRCCLCGRKAGWEKHKRTYEYVKNFFEKHNCKLISNKYIRMREKLDYICRCGNFASRRFERFEKNPGCKMCNYLHRFNLQKISRDREIYEILKWKRKLLISNKKCCQKCNSGNELVAHHLNGWNWYKEGRFLLENGVILCKKCHKLFHLIFGCGNNTILQYNKWNNEKPISNLHLIGHARNFVNKFALLKNPNHLLHNDLEIYPYKIQTIH